MTSIQVEMMDRVLIVKFVFISFILLFVMKPVSGLSSYLRLC